jgi:hypothetical protein
LYATSITTRRLTHVRAMFSNLLPFEILFEFCIKYIEHASLPTNGEDNNTLMSFTMKIHEFDFCKSHLRTLLPTNGEDNNTLMSFTMKIHEFNFCKSHLRTLLPTNGEDKVREKNLKNRNQKFWLSDKMPKNDKSSIQTNIEEAIGRGEEKIDLPELFEFHKERTIFF